jgi:hypothetical protein
MGSPRHKLSTKKNDNEKECTFYWERPMGRSKTHHKKRFLEKSPSIATAIVILLRVKRFAE